MNFQRLFFLNLWFHRRGNLAVLLGVAVGTAVLVGALLVGDSLRGSLRDQTLHRLAGVHQLLILPRFVPSPGLVVNPTLTSAVQPAIIVHGSVEVERAGSVTRVSNVVMHTYLPQPAVAPVNSRLVSPNVTPAAGKSSIAQAKPPTPIPPGQALLAPALARELGLKTTATIRVRVPRYSAVARDTLLGRKTIDDISQATNVEGNILPADDQRGWFNPMPGLGQSHAIVLNPDDLRGLLGLQPNTFNALLTLDARTPPTFDPSLNTFGLALRTPETRTNELLRLLDRDKNQQLEPREYRRRLGEAMIQSADTNNDKSLTKDELLDYFNRRGSVDLEAEGLLLTPAAEHAALDAAKILNVRAASTLIYLANAISDGTNEIPYSVIAALDPQLPAPLGLNHPALANDEILLADWPDSPLAVSRGAAITVRYFLPESDGKATEATATFKLRGKVPLAGLAADPYLAPEFPGITDKLTLGEWDPPFPYDNRKIKKRDEDFWDRYRAAPKAYVNLKTGRKLFGSRFGMATSVRFATLDGQRVQDELLKQMRPEDFGLIFEDVRTKALSAAEGGTDFGGLFAGFSFFLIAAALMLVSLLWRLNLDRRASEIGLLLASGYRIRTVRRLLLCEGMSIAAWGAGLGLLLSIGYATVMLQLLAALWPDGEVGSFLQLHVTVKTLAIGFVAMMLLTGLTIAWSLRALRRVSPVALLRGVNESARESIKKPRLWLAPIWVTGGLVATVSGMFIENHEAKAGAFFVGGALLLTAGLWAFRAWLRTRQSSPLAASPAQLGRRNASRNPGRSLLTAGLLASAAFLLVVVESFRRHPAEDFNKKTGGSGGYDLVATLDIPLYHDPSDPTTGRKEILDALEREYQKDPGTKQFRLQQAEQLLAASTLMPLRLRSGDDAGCRNLARPDKPRLIGVPERFIDHGGFHFAAVTDKTGDPWKLLNNVDSAVPVFGEANTVEWMLKSKLGGTLPITDSRGQAAQLKIVGTLQDSIFQGELVMAERRFLELFPETQGYAMLLATAPAGRVDELRALLETAYADHGLAATPAIDRLTSYLAVENTYLSTFQILGGFGLLLGACGLAVVLVRSANERRAELALLRAVGWSPNRVGSMIRAENAFLVLVGLGIGVGAALIGIAPMLLSGEASVRPLGRVAVMLVAAVVLAWLFGAWAVRSAVRAPIITALREE